MPTTNLLDVAVDLEEMGRRIDRAREQAGLTVSKLSFATEIDDGMIRRYIRGETEPGATKLARLAEVLNVNTDWLLQNTENPAPVPDVWVPGKSVERRASSPTGGGGPPKGAVDPPKRTRQRRRRTA